MKPFLGMASLGLACLYGLATAVASDVLTNHNSNARTGYISDEKLLTPANVAGLKILLSENPGRSGLCAAALRLESVGLQAWRVTGKTRRRDCGHRAWLRLCIQRKERRNFIGTFRCLTRGIVPSKLLTRISIAPIWCRKSVSPQPR